MGAGAAAGVAAGAAAAATAAAEAGGGVHPPGFPQDAKARKRM